MFQDEYDAVIGKIYEASYQPEQWPEALAAIAQVTESRSSAIVYMNNGYPDANLTHSYNVTPEAVHDYMTKYGALDPFATLVTTLPLGTAASDTQLVPNRKELEALCGEFFSDYMLKHDHYHIGGAALFHDANQMAAIAVQRSRAQGPWPDECMTRLTTLTPHLQRAFRIHTEFIRLHSQRDSAYAALDKLMIGVVLLNSANKINYINPIAKGLIRQHPAIDIRHDRLHINDPGEFQRFDQVLRNAQTDDARQAEASSQALGIHHPDTSVPLPLLVLPVANTALPWRLPGESAEVAVIVTDPMRPTAEFPEALGEIYGLSESEAQVAIALTNGMKPEHIAEQRGTSVHTVRNQLKSIFFKTHTENQAQLVKLLLSGPHAVI